jgi:hypothetical protein
VAPCSSFIARCPSVMLAPALITPHRSGVRQARRDMAPATCRQLPWSRSRSVPTIGRMRVEFSGDLRRPIGRHRSPAGRR